MLLATALLPGKGFGEEDEDCDPAHCTKVVAQRITCEEGVICISGGSGNQIFTEPSLMPGLGAELGDGGFAPPQEEPLVEDSIACWRDVVASDFAVVSSPFNAPRTNGPHKGFDIALPTGTPVFAARVGNVIDVRAHEELFPPEEDTSPEAEERRTQATSTGSFVTIGYSNGSTGRYLHLRKGFVAVELGQSVAAGQYIGHSNATETGISGPHLHYDHKTDGD